MSKPTAFLDQEASFRGRYSRQVFESLFFAYRPILLPIILMIISGFLGRLALLSNANVIGIWVDAICLRSTSAEQLHCRQVPDFFAGWNDVKFVYFLLATAGLGFFLTAFFRIGFSRLSAAAVSRFYDEVTLRTSRLPIQFFDTNPVGRIVTRFSSDYGNVFRLFGGPLAEFFAIVFDLICMLFLVSLASPLYMPVVIFVGLANYLIYRLNREKLRVERRELSAWRSPSIAHFSETAQGASTIRVFGRQVTFMERFAHLNDRFLQQRIRTAVALTKFSLQMSVLTAFVLLGTGISGYWLAKNGWVSIGSVGVVFTFIAFSGNSMQMFFEWFAQFEEAMTGVERLNDYLRRSLEPGNKLPAWRQFPTDHPFYSAAAENELARARLTDERNAAVAVENLWFRYGSDAPFVLKGLDLQIAAGEKIGIVGRTGSGKTSFVQALFHLYPLERGHIRIAGLAPDVGGAADNGAPASGAESGVDLGLFRRAIALISQEPVLFRGSIRENLDLSRAKDDSGLLAALERVGLQDWLRAQPSGLDSPIEERGRNLSAGEKQLLCMARCLLQDAPVVVMDEATSAVDPQSEEILVRATREFFADRTQIIIAHRLSTLSHCDRIVWLHKGEVRMVDRPERVLPVFEATRLS